MQKSGELTENGFVAGKMILSYADDEKSEQLTRVEVTEVIDGAQNVKGAEYEGRTFSLQTKDKVIAFAAADKAEKTKWFDTLSSALSNMKKEADNMNASYTFDYEFKESPLGFRVEERFITEGEKQVEVLMVTKIQDEFEHLREVGLMEGLVVIACGETDFRPLKYPEKLEIIRNSEYPMKLTFEGKNYMKEAGASAGHNRDVSMQLLYPELFNALTTEGSEEREDLLKHPLVQSNPEIKKWLERPDFKDLLQDLMTDPDKLRDFLMNKTL